LALGVGYFPIDWWPFSRRGWRRIAPDLVLLTEGERWPEHIHQAHQRKVPVLCINARLSDRSFQRMKTWRRASAALLEKISRVLPCSPVDAERFKHLGVPESKLTVTGNIKLDLTIPLLNDAERVALRAELGLPSEAFVILGSSTWPGEEDSLVRVLKVLRQAGVPAALLLVPRHAERRHELETLLQASGLAFHLRSLGAASGPVDIALADTTGELRKLTQLADLVFVGKSLPPHDQGQTPVEAAALGKPVLFGPGMTNFRVIAAELVAGGAAQTVADADELARRVRELAGDAPARAKMASAAQAWHRANQGAVSRTLAVIREELEALPASPGGAGN
jgi:3-deoxy-D-manno-octulosonic-acid transferase